jgi:hypothetical protein
MHSHEAIGVVERGKVKLPKNVRLADGTAVRVTWGDADASLALPYDRHPVTEGDVRADIAWAVREYRTR